MNAHAHLEMDGSANAVSYFTQSTPIQRALTQGVLPGPNIVAAGRIICMTGGHGSFAGRCHPG